MSEVLDFAVVGAGRLGTIHARVLANITGVRLTHVVDIDADRAGAVAAAAGATAVTSTAALPATTRCAIVATPTSEHHAVAKSLLERGIHVLVEKPITTTPAEARDLISVARSTGTTLMVGHSERFNPAVKALDRLALAPRFVESQRVSPFSFRSADIGVVLDMMIHDIDIILHLVKSPVASVHAVGVAVIGVNEDIANARLTFENGTVANATASRVALKTERVIRIFSPEMYVALDYQKKTGRIIRRGPALESGIDLSTMASRGIVDPLEYMRRDLVRVEDIAMDDVEPLQAEDEAFAHAVRTRTEPLVTGEHGLRALEIAQRIVVSLRESSERGTPAL